MRISTDTARRFLLGRQGLWPGRRWRGLDGTEQAMQTMQNVQLDPLQVVGRAQDLALHSRVIDYRQDDWMTLTYERRRFFEWGGWLALRPMDELPYFRVLMRRFPDSKWGRWAASGNGQAIEAMRAILRERGEVSNRDFSMADHRAPERSYWGRKSSAIALNWLWRAGEAMVTRRERYERVYAPTEAVAPATLLQAAPDTEADDFLLMKAVAAAGLTKLNGAEGLLMRPFSSRDAAAWKRGKVEASQLVEIEVDGLTGARLALAADLPVLEAIAAGRVPPAWRPLDTTTTDEVTFLSPLDPVIHDRARTHAIFEFDYKWEVYDKLEKRKFGYYVLPMLWKDRLVGRIEPVIDAPTKELAIRGTWFEDGALSRDPTLAAALARGLARLTEYSRTL